MELESIFCLTGHGNGGIYDIADMVGVRLSDWEGERVIGVMCGMTPLVGYGCLNEECDGDIEDNW
jgi:hypothetical protein